MSEDRRPSPAGWTVYPTERSPGPTASPVLFAFGVTLLAWGIVSSFVISLIGMTVVVVSLLHWIGEIAHDAK